MNTALTRRIGKLEAGDREQRRQRFRAAVASLAASLTPAHARSIRDWVMATPPDGSACEVGHAEHRFCLRCIEADDPPALVRAMWVMLFEHIEHGVPVTLPPDVAQVYVDHPDAVPAVPCPACGYLLPGRDGRLAYDGPCPGCEMVPAGRG